MSTQPEALRLADALNDWSEGPDTSVVLDEAAAELRRLHAQRVALLDVLKQIAGAAQRADNLMSDMFCLRLRRFTPDVKAAPQQDAIGSVESAVVGNGGFHARLAAGAQMPAVGTKLYTAQPAPSGDAGHDIEAAAKALAECMDYPWEHMPEKGREEMRKHAQAVIDAARKEGEVMSTKQITKREMVLYHATTPKKVRKYHASRRIITPVRGFTTLQAAMAWACKTGRSVVLEVHGEDCHKLPDHHNAFGDAWWIDHDVTTWQCVFSPKDA